MPIRKKGDIEIQTSPNGAKVSQSGYIFYSYDKNSAALYFQFREQTGGPVDLAKANVQILLILNEDNERRFVVDSNEIEIISAVQGKAKYVIPEMLLSYEGKVTGYVYLEFDDGSRSDDGQFTFRIKHSMITHVLPEIGANYVQSFEDVKERVEQAGDKARNDMQDNVDQVNKDYETWKAEQKQENQDFQDEYKKHWNNFKNTQNKNRTNFEDDFKKWKETQEDKQTDFETDTNKTISGINSKVETAQTKVADLEKSLDVEQKNYFSVTAWENKDDWTITNGKIQAIKINLEVNTEYTLSTNVPKSGNNDDIFFTTGDKNTVNTPSDGVSIDNPRTVTTNDDGVVIVAIRDKDMSSGNWWIMLNKGSTAYSWTPNADDLATKQQVDKKLEAKADKTVLDSKVDKDDLDKKANVTDLDKKADKSTVKSDLDNKLDKTSFDDFTEHGFLELEKGFENYYENDTEKTDRDSTLLKYTRVGPLLHVFGIITNTVRLEEGSSTIVTYIPDHLKVASRDVKVSQGSQNNLFTSMALSYENDRYTNAITIERLRDDNGNDTGYNPGKFLNISLTFTVEVVK